MSTATNSKVAASGSDVPARREPSQGPGALEVLGPVTRVPSLEELERLTEVPDRRVVFRGVDWAFYEQLVNSIPEWCHLHVDYDGKDLDVLRKGILNQRARVKLDGTVRLTAEAFQIPFSGTGSPTFMRPGIGCGLEPDGGYLFVWEKMVAYAAALKRGSDDIADYPDLDLAIEVDISPPQTDRARIYAALRVPEVWRFDGKAVVIEQLTPDGKYAAVTGSRFLPICADEIRRWVAGERYADDTTWSRQFVAYIKSRGERRT